MLIRIQVQKHHMLTQIIVATLIQMKRQISLVEEEEVNTLYMIQGYKFQAFQSA